MKLVFKRALVVPFKVVVEQKVMGALVISTPVECPGCTVDGGH